MYSNVTDASFLEKNNRVSGVQNVNPCIFEELIDNPFVDATTGIIDTFLLIISRLFMKFACKSLFKERKKKGEITKIPKYGENSKLKVPKQIEK